MRAGPGPSALSPAPRRLVLYSFFDAGGHVDGFVIRALLGLRPHAHRVVVVVNGEVDEDGFGRLSEVADAVVRRPNVGFDIGAHRDVMLGRLEIGASLADYDEVVMTNDTWYGPVGPWADVFARSDGAAVDFWGLTDHALARRNPLRRRGVPYHLQSYWIAVRREMLRSDDWRRYWSSLGSIRTYADAVRRHELRFTSFFSRRKWRFTCAFPYRLFDTENPSLFEAEALILAGCPALKRRALFHWPPLLASRGSIGPNVLRAAEAAGYPTSAVLANLARTVPPRVVNVAAGLHDVVVARAVEDAAPAPFARALVVGSMPPGSAVAAFAERVGAVARTLGVHVDARVSVADDDVAGQLGDELRSAGCAEVRVDRRAPRDDDVSRWAEAAGAAADDSRYDVVLCLGRTEDRRLESLIAQPDTLSTIVRRFRDEPGLGLVFASLDHRGGELIGNGWAGLAPRCAHVGATLGVRVPLDDVSPLAPFGGSVLARPSALRLLASRDIIMDALSADPPEIADGVLDRLLAAAAGALGMHTRTVVSAVDFARIYPLLEYETSMMASALSGETFERIDLIRHSGAVRAGSVRDLALMYVRRRHMRLVHVARRLADPGRRPGRWARLGR